MFTTEINTSMGTEELSLMDMKARKMERDSFRMESRPARYVPLEKSTEDKKSFGPSVDGVNLICAGCK